MKVRDEGQRSQKIKQWSYLTNYYTQRHPYLLDIKAKVKQRSQVWRYLRSLNASCYYCIIFFSMQTSSVLLAILLHSGWFSSEDRDLLLANFINGKMDPDYLSKHGTAIFIYPFEVLHSIISKYLKFHFVVFFKRS